MSVATFANRILLCSYHTFFPGASLILQKGMDQFQSRPQMVDSTLCMQLEIRLAVVK